VSRRSLERLGLVALGGLLLLILASATLIDRTPPTVASIGLNRTAGDDHTAPTHVAVDVVFSEPVREPGAEQHFRIQPAVPGSFSWVDDRSMVFTPDAKLPLATQFSVRIEAGVQDLAGNIQGSPSSTFTFRTVDRPSLLASQPADGATGVSLEAPIRLTFDRLMDTQSTAAAVQLTPAANLRASWQGPVLTLTPTTSLQPSTAYVLTIASGAADTDGNTLAASLSIRFETLSVGLGVERVLPADGSAGVSLGGPIAIIFQGPIDPATVADSITITPSVTGQATAVPLPDDTPPGGGGAATPTPGPSSSPTPGASGGPAPPQVLLFTPSSPLAPNTTYTVQLSSGVVRGLGSSVSAPARTWSFTTGSPGGPLQNQVLFRSARGGVENVWAMNPDGTNAHQVTGELVPVTSYDVSADGRVLVYAAAGEVKRLELPSGTVTVLTEPTDADYAPRLLPDGSGVLVGRRDRATGADLGWWLVPLDGSGTVRQVLPDGAPSMGSVGGDQEVPGGVTGGPGAWTAIEGVAEDGSQALLPAADGTLRLVTLAPGGGVLPVPLQVPLGPADWSSKVLGGVFVVAARGVSDGQVAVWTVGLDGVPVAGPSTAGWASVGPDGSLTQLSASADGHLVYRPSLSGPATVLTSSADLLDRQPTFGPGGGSIIFVRVPATQPQTSAGIWSVATDGLELRQLSLDGSDPRWLP
jgi:hypothetical protein